MLRDELVKYYYSGNGYNYNCAESMLHALDDYYHLHLPRQMFLAASSFGGGCRHDEMCGGLASALSVLGVLYSVDGRGHDSPLLRELTDQLFRKFDERFSTSRCVRLKQENYIPGRKCEPILVVCADIIEEIIRDNPPAGR